MKKLFVLVLALVCVVGAAGCISPTSDTDENGISVYSFTGNHELFEIPNGVIALTDDKDVFDGGDLKILRSESFSDIASYSTKFYTIKNGEKRVILSNGVEDMSGGTVVVEGDLGRISGDGVLDYDLEENIWFELITISLDGKENAYQIQLTLEEILS